LKTLSRLFDTYESASGAVHALESAGIPEDDVSLIANNSSQWFDRGSDNAGENTAAGVGMGAALCGAGGLLTGLGLLAIPGVGPVVGAGWLAATAVGAAMGGVAGGLLGALTDAGVSESDAHLYAEGVRRGGAVVAARVDDAQAAMAQSILGGDGVDLDTRRNAYEPGGWTGFASDAPPLTAEEVQEEQERYYGRRMPIVES